MALATSIGEQLLQAVEAALAAAYAALAPADQAVFKIYPARIDPLDSSEERECELPALCFYASDETPEETGRGHQTTERTLTVKLEFSAQGDTRRAVVDQMYVFAIKAILGAELDATVVEGASKWDQ